MDISIKNPSLYMSLEPGEVIYFLEKAALYIVTDASKDNSIVSLVNLESGMCAPSMTKFFVMENFVPVHASLVATRLA